MNGQLLGEARRAPRTIASSLFAMNVSAIQAMPKRAIIATMPDLKICVFGMSRRVDVANSRISAAAASMTIWMSGVTDIGSTPPPSAATVGRMPSNEAEDADRERRRARKIATLRFA